MMKPFIGILLVLCIVTGVGLISYAQEGVPISKDKPIKVDSLPDALAKKSTMDITPDGKALIKRDENDEIPFDMSKGGPCALCTGIWNIPPNFTVPIGSNDAIRSGPNGATLKRVENKGLILLKGEAYLLKTEKDK